MGKGDKWHLFLLLGLVVLLSGSMIACQKPAIVAVTPASLSFTAGQGEANALVRTLTISNDGRETLSWSLSSSAPWLTLRPSNGTSTSEVDNISVLADVSGMDRGNYNATITISAPEASNSPQTVPVSLYIGPPRQVLFSDNFSDETSGWETFIGEDSSAYYKDGWLHITNRIGAKYFSRSLIHKDFSDFTLEVETKTVNGTFYNWYAVLCRVSKDPVTEEWSSYAFAISADGYYGIFKDINGEVTELVPTNRSPHINKGLGIINLMQVECAGSNLRLSVNGHLLAEVQDFALDSGELALEAGALHALGSQAFTEIAFDNIRVTHP